jgi:hypothetical protein
MAVAFNMVRMRVKPDCESEFLALNENPGHEVERGLRTACLIRTGERCYCLIGEWDSLDALAAAGPAMGQDLDRLRPLLEDWAEGVGFADAVSGAVIARLRPRIEEGDCRSC